MRSIRFLFIGEGSVDDALVPHLAADASIARRVKRLLEDLDPEGEVTQVLAWQRMKESLVQVLGKIRP